LHIHCDNGCTNDPQYYVILYCSSHEFGSLSELRDKSKLNLGSYGGVPDLTLVLQCDGASLAIWFRATEVCGHTFEYETVSLLQKDEKQVPGDTASYRSFTDNSSNIL